MPVGVSSHLAFFFLGAASTGVASHVIIIGVSPGSDETIVGVTVAHCSPSFGVMEGVSRAEGVSMPVGVSSHLAFFFLGAASTGVASHVIIIGVSPGSDETIVGVTVA